ncbi:MAG: phosphoglycerate kinase [Rikenellaceae bacterium]|nr:phosphoglycerate kinase [Rikenellaceae bacterium]
MNSIDTYDFSGKRAIIRVDFNVPLNEKLEVTDATRIRAAIPTIKKVLEKGGSVILMSHLGRPKKGPEDKFSLKHIIPTIEQLLGVKVDFAPDCMGKEAAEKAAALKPGQVLLLENLRFYAEEEGKPRGLAEDATDDEKAAAKKAVKESQKEFTKKLASYADVYINDAFGTAHRAHASTALIAEYFPNDKMFGYVMEGELKAIDKVLDSPARPFTAILGGSKVSSKITIIEKLLQKVDNLILGGGMTYTFMAALGGKVGDSICEPDQFDTAKSILAKAKELGVKVFLAEDALCADAFSNEANTKVCPSNDIPDGWEGLDIGPKAEEAFRKVILESKTILWNGPVGVFEMSKFEGGSKAIALAIAEATKKGAYSLIGGGDSVACINKFGLAKEVSYVSTGGGALLEYMEGAVLPGVAAIRK